MSYCKIAVRGGHTPTCCGASGIIDEVAEDRKVKNALISILQDKGVEVLDVTPPDNYNTVSRELVYGVQAANNWGADLMVSCHFNNAYDNTVNTAMGSEVVVKSYGTLGAAVGKAFGDLGFKVRNPENNGQLISGRGLYEMRATNMETIIVEPCFVESTVDVAIYNSVGAEGIAQAIAGAILGDSSLVGKSGAWVQDNTGWYYEYTDGTFATGLTKIKGKIYLFGDNGYMKTGWQQDSDNTWYYLYSDGQAAIGWAKINNKWYYFGTDGSMKTGWVKDSGYWYYMATSGELCTGWIKPDCKTWYYLYSNGQMATGWLSEGGKSYYLLDSGAMKTGWIQLDSKWYYLKPSDGSMVTDWQEIDDVQYYFYSDGTMAHDKDDLYGYKVDNTGKCTKN